MQPHKKIAAASTNATNLKTVSGVVGGIIAINLTATVKYLKLYDKASSPTVGTDTPVMTIPIPASSDGNGFVWNVPVSFANGIGYALTGAASDNDTTALTAGDVILNIAWE